MSYDKIHTIRYMGIKNKLLDFIIPEIEKITKPGDVICDIMAGTNSIGYALKQRNIIYSNDIQEYSFILAKCLLNNFYIPDVDTVKNELRKGYYENLVNKKFNFFEKEYSDTYFSKKQCEEIDSLRYSIEQVTDDNIKSLYLTALMSAMCKAQSTTGHFAQFLDKNHRRVVPLRTMSIVTLFYEKIAELSKIVQSKYNNLQFNLDYNTLFNQNVMDNVDCFYLDSPYTSDQYSRFYHILETVCKYDNPKLKFKAKYRIDRAQSGFCYKSKVEGEFEKIISYCKSKNASLVISYSNHGVLSIENLVDISKKYYEDVEIKYYDFEHSSQGKGVIKIKEVLLILK